jgi:predicted RNase H-like HicB family nuclease
VPALSGCHTWAENYDDLIVMVKEAIEGWLEVSHEKKLPDQKENQQLVEISI